MDADTNQPIAGAAIWLNSNVGCFGLGSGYHRELGPFETRTDKEGHFGISGGLTLPPDCLALGSRSDDLGILAPGYFIETFEQGRSWSLGIPFDEVYSGPVKLDRINYLAEFEHYRLRPMEVSSDWLDRNSGSVWKETVSTVRSMPFKTTGKSGVFTSRPGAVFQEMAFAVFTWEPRPRRRIAILAKDQNGGTIVTWTVKGLEISRTLPETEHLLGSHDRLGYPFLAQNDRIYYPQVWEFPLTPTNFDAANWAWAPAQYGQVKTAASGGNFLFTNEAEGNQLGIYKLEERPVATNKINILLTEGPRVSIAKLLPGGKPPIECITAGRDDSLFVVAHSSAGRTLYFRPGWTKELKMERVQVPDGILTDEVTACAATKSLISSSLYLAIKNAGIRQLKLRSPGEPSKPQVIGEGPFWQNSKPIVMNRPTGPKNFTRLAVSELEEYWELVYGVAGDDAIYRFTADGVPDQRIALELPQR